MGAPLSVGAAFLSLYRHPALTIPRQRPGYNNGGTAHSGGGAVPGVRNHRSA